MNPIHIQVIARELMIDSRFIQNTVKLLLEGATVPFISRYRKEMTGEMDETIVLSINDRFQQLIELDKRKETVIKSIKELNKLSKELEDSILNCWDIHELEDIYLPFKPKRKTKASVARENGLEPLAKILMAQKELNIEKRAEEFINEKVKSIDEALSGAQDIIAEWVNENKRARSIVRQLFERKAIVTSKVIKGKEIAGQKYLDYFDTKESLKRMPSHRLLAIRRGEAEGFLRISVEPPIDDAISALNNIFVYGVYNVSKRVEEAVKDSYKRLMQPSMETEFKQVSKLKADEEAIRVFAENLRQLLLQAPLGEKPVLALDPGFKSGCKLVCLNAQADLVFHDTIYPLPPQVDEKKAAEKLNSLIAKYAIEAIAIGNGTASRETEAFVRNYVDLKKVQVFVVSESGASIYSASKVARDEFPDIDLTVRGSVSIGRRLMDPLAELVKIDPKSIGVGQYQHDVDQQLLSKSLDHVVLSCVNKVGVDLNTASQHLLQYVSGLGPVLAKNIIEYRTGNGKFASRTELMKVPRLGDKAFEQAAGFLRIRNAKNPLDNTGIHPESYPIVQKMAQTLNTTIHELIANATLRKSIDPKQFVSATVGNITISDILKELEKPGRDPRSQLLSFTFDERVKTIDDLIPGMLLPGIVTNITNFGAFVDIGVKTDGLVHISQLSDKFVNNPADVVHLGQHVNVKVLMVEKERKRINLSMLV